MAKASRPEKSGIAQTFFLSLCLCRHVHIIYILYILVYLEKLNLVYSICAGIIADYKLSIHLLNNFKAK